MIRVWHWPVQCRHCWKPFWKMEFIETSQSLINECAGFGKGVNHEFGKEKIFLFKNEPVMRRDPPKSSDLIFKVKPGSFSQFISSCVPLFFYNPAPGQWYFIIFSHEQGQKDIMTCWTWRLQCYLSHLMQHKCNISLLYLKGLTSLLWVPLLLLWWS